MNQFVIRSSIAALVTVLAVASAEAQEQRRQGNRNGGQQATAAQQQSGASQRQGNGQRGSGQQQATTPQAPAPAPVAQPTGGFGGFFGRNAATPGIDRTQAMQSWEIEQARRRGALTDAEARQLKAEQDRIADLERRAKADGNVTRDERVQIRNAQREAEKHIWQESHDSERERGRQRGYRGWYSGWW